MGANREDAEHSMKLKNSSEGRRKHIGQRRKQEPIGKRSNQRNYLKDRPREKLSRPAGGETEEGDDETEGGGRVGRVGGHR